MVPLKCPCIWKRLYPLVLTFCSFLKSSLLNIALLFWDWDHCSKCFYDFLCFLNNVDLYCIMVIVKMCILRKNVLKSFPALLNWLFFRVSLYRDCFMAQVHCVKMLFPSHLGVRFAQSTARWWLKYVIIAFPSICLISVTISWLLHLLAEHSVRESWQLYSPLLKPGISIQRIL